MCPEAWCFSWDPSLTNGGEPVGEEMNKLIPAAGGNHSRWEEMRLRVTCSIELASVSAESRVDRDRWTVLSFLLSEQPQAPRHLAAGTSFIFLPVPLSLVHTHTHAQEDAFLVADTPSLVSFS